MQLTDDQVKKAVEWWSSKMQCPSSNMGEDSVAAANVSVIRTMIATSETKSGLWDGKMLVFKTEFEKLLRKNNPSSLHTDYHPERELLVAAEKADISDTMFPLKTHMWFFSAGRIKVAEGYGKEGVWL